MRWGVGFRATFMNGFECSAKHSHKPIASVLVYPPPPQNPRSPSFLNLRPSLPHRLGDVFRKRRDRR
jgi:hypothetical protein